MRQKYRERKAAGVRAGAYCGEVLLEGVVECTIFVHGLTHCIMFAAGFVPFSENNENTDNTGDTCNIQEAAI